MTQLRPSPQVYSIGSLAKHFSVSSQTIRNWEDQALIPRSVRTLGGHRRYSLEHVQAIEKMIGFGSAIFVE